MASADEDVNTEIQETFEGPETQPEQHDAIQNTKFRRAWGA